MWNRLAPYVQRLFGRHGKSTRPGSDQEGKLSPDTKRSAMIKPGRKLNQSIRGNRSYFVAAQALLDKGSAQLQGQLQGQRVFEALKDLERKREA
ncbi:hypothetical protein V6N12_013724 [Hibiscus sabdariffa]|uniref:Uncharacterized protein n=1 Tax=Hibiscus sabdariffa TaxID=183260 RepID=A0ABR2CV00_9ROSI